MVLEAGNADGLSDRLLRHWWLNLLVGIIRRVLFDPGKEPRLPGFLQEAVFSTRLGNPSLQASVAILPTY